MKYYQIRDDVHFPDRWHLGNIVESENNWEFTSGNMVDEAKLPNKMHVNISHDGILMDYTTNGAFSVPIVSEKIKMQLGGVKTLQFIPVEIVGKQPNLNFFIMVVSLKLDCVNEKLSEFGKFVEDDPVRPDKAGHYSWFTKLVIDKNKVANEDIFRIEKAENDIIISERVKNALEDVNASGFVLVEV